MIRIETSFCSPRGKGAAHIVWDTCTGKYSVMTEDAKGNTQFPLRGPSGITYDFPERVPNYLKQLATRAFKVLYI